MEITFGLRSFIVGPTIYSQWKIYDYLVIENNFPSTTYLLRCRRVADKSLGLRVSWSHGLGSLRNSDLNEAGLSLDNIQIATMKTFVSNI